MSREMSIITKDAADTFEEEMIAKNFVVGKYVLMATAVNFLIVSKEEEMLKHAAEYDAKVNRVWSIPFFVVKSNVVKSVLHKEVNQVNKQITYMFQKDGSTVVKLTVQIQ